MSKRRVTLWGQFKERFVVIEDEATKGATLGVDLYREDGSVVTEDDLPESGDSGNSGGAIGFAYTIWKYIREIPANIVSLENLTGIGFASRISTASAWAVREITGSGRINVANGDGVSGDPLITLNELAYVGIGIENMLLESGDALLLESGDELLLEESVDDPYSVQVDDCTVNMQSGSFTVTLPTAVGVQGQVYNLKNSGSGVIPIATTSGQTIDGNASSALSLIQYENLQVQSDGSNWMIL